MGKAINKRRFPFLLAMLLLFQVTVPYVGFASEETESANIEIGTELREQSQDELQEYIYMETEEERINAEIGMTEEETELQETQETEEERAETEEKSQTIDTETETDELYIVETQEQTEVAAREEEIITEPESEAFASEESSENIDEYEFDDVVTIENTRIHVSATEGVFPKGCVLTARSVSDDVQEKIQALLAEEQSDFQKILGVDIRILDIKGEEIQPDISKGSVQVSFELEEENSGLNAIIYHVSDDYQLEKLDSIETNGKFFVETEGFSVYAIVLVDRNLKKAMPGESCVVLYQDGTLIFQNSEDNFSDDHGEIAETYIYEENACPWLEKREAITIVDFQTEIHPKTMEAWFADCINLEQVLHTEKIDASQTVSVKRLFQNCSSLKKIDLSRIKPLSMENVEGIFLGCKELEKVNFSNVVFAASTNVGQLVNMFVGCDSLTEIECTFWTIPGITSMAGCSQWSGMGQLMNLKNLNMAHLKTPELTTAESMFSSIPYIEEINLSFWEAPKLKSIGGIFQDNTELKRINLDGFNTQNVTDMSLAFYKCTSLKNFGTMGIAYWDTSKVINMNSMFYDCVSLTAIDIQRWNVSQVTVLANMFYGCKNIEEINLRNWQVDKVLSTQNMFYGCRGLKRIDLSGWYITGRNNVSGMLATGGTIDQIYLDHWSIQDVVSFSTSVLGLNNDETSVINLSMSYLNTPNLQNADSFFGNMKDMVSLNASYWNCPKVINMSGIFSGDYSLKTLDIRGMRTDNAISLSYAFRECYSLTSLDLTQWNTAKVTSMCGMFENCINLESLDISTWDTSSVTDMSYMFSKCSSLKALDIHNFRTGKVVYAWFLFEECENLREIDLSNFNTGSMKDMHGFLLKCKNLKKITLGKHFSFIGQEDGLPYPDWYQLKTKELVKNLWNHYDGETMEGCFVREIYTTLDSDTVDLLEYERESGIITAYTVSQSGKSPVHVDTPYVLCGVLFDRKLLENSEELLSDIERGDVDVLTLNYKNRTYIDVMNCSEAEKAIWTFNVPAENSKVFQMEIYSFDGKKKCASLNNSEENPDIFTMYDSEGEVMEVLMPNIRHTYRDLGFIGEEDFKVDPESYPYPEYKDYITYKPGMNNYEIVLTPGHYAIDVFMSEYENIPLEAAVEMNQTREEEEKNVITGYYYHTGIVEEPVYATFTLMNLIRKVSTIRLMQSSDQYGKLLKTDSTGKGVEGAVYQFVSEKDGKTVYGKTDSIGEIDYHNLYFSSDEGKTFGERYAPELQECFWAREVIAPDGYYLNREKIEVIFYIFHDSEEYQEMADLYYRDGVSISSADSDEEHCESCCQKTIEDGIRCLCYDFGSCSCNNCGNSFRYESNNVTVFRTQDQKIPRLPNTGGKGRRLPYQNLFAITILLLGTGMLLTRKVHVDSDKT